MFVPALMFSIMALVAVLGAFQYRRLGNMKKFRSDLVVASIAGVIGFVLFCLLFSLHNPRAWGGFPTICLVYGNC
jgi:hypothetical protein